MRELMLPKNLGDYIEARDIAVERITRAYQTLRDADADAKGFIPHGLYYEVVPRISVAEAISRTDERFWRVAFDLTGFMQLMDEKAINEFYKSMEKDVPAFNMDNVRTTFLQLHQDADMMFKRGIVRVFQQFMPHEYRTNSKEPFKLDRRAVIGWGTENWSGLRVNHHASGRVNDIDRVFKTLDDKQHKPRELEHAINAAFVNGNVYEDEYYQFKGYKKGTLHVLFKRADLLEKVNRLIHDYFDGRALA